MNSIPIAFSHRSFPFYPKRVMLIVPYFYHYKKLQITSLLISPSFNFPQNAFKIFAHIHNTTFLQDNFCLPKPNCLLFLICMSPRNNALKKHRRCITNLTNRYHQFINNKESACHIIQGVKMHNPLVPFGTLYTKSSL